MNFLKKILFLFLLISVYCFIPKTYAFTVDNTSFDNPIGYYKNLNNKIYDVANGINQFKYYSSGDYIDYIVRLTAVNSSNVASGQLLLYVNVCFTESNYHMLQKLNYIDNSIGVVSELENIANNMNSTLGSCKTGDGRGYLYTGVWSMSYILQRDTSNGYSFLDSNIYFTSNRTLNYATTFKFNNIYVTDYDENVVQNLKQQQITSATNTYLQQQIQQQQQTNEKLDDLNQNITNDDISGSQNTANGFFDNFTSNDYGLSSIITIPLTSIQKITNSTCIPLRLPIPFVNKTIDLPCMYDIYNNVPIILNIWQVVSFGLISYAIIVDIFAMVKKFKDPNDDKLEVMDL